MAGQFKPQEQPSATTFNILLAAVFIDVFCSCTTDPLRPSLLVSMGFDGPAVITSVLARMTAAAATSEFIFNPLCGRLSDKYGRKTFLVGGLLGSALANTALFLPFLLGKRPALPLLIFERCMRTTSDTVFFTNVRASMSDFLAGAELTISASRVAMAAGVGVLLGPAFSTRLIVPLFGKPLLQQGINVAVLCTTAAVLASSLRETLPEEKRMPMDWSRANPISFTKLLLASRTMFLWMSASCLQTFIDGRNILESNFVFLESQLNFDRTALADYQSFAGVKIFIGGFLGKPMMNAFGQLGLTSVSNAINFVAQAMGIFAKQISALAGCSVAATMYGHVLMTGIGERKRDGVETLLTVEASQLGFGRGEIAAGLSNWRSIANILSPILFAEAYNLGVARGFPAAMFLSRMIVGAVLPEIMFRMVPRAERLRMVEQSQQGPGTPKPKAGEKGSE
jgi:MFS family permease